MIYGVDPGPLYSGIVSLDGGPGPHLEPWAQGCAPIGILPNREALRCLEQRGASGALLAIEMVSSFGMPVGAEVFETVYWIGRFRQAWSGPVRRVTRHHVKLYLCQSARAKDSNIRQAIVDRYGGNDKAAKGTKKHPGPLYGFKADLWSALAVALTAHETEGKLDE